MTTTTTRPRPTLTLVETKRWNSKSSAPNGSVRNVTDYYTELTFNEVWPEYEEPEISSKGLYAEPTGRMRRGTYSGAVYRRVECYISGTPDHIGQLIGSTSGPWPAAE
jgi:hypothetical protein